jgi:hypothetical protein
MLAALLIAAPCAEEIRTRSVVRLSLRSGERRDFSFPVPNTIVLFEETRGFRALFGTGQGRVDMIGSREDGSASSGSFFGSHVGRVRLYAPTDCEVSLIALVPPEPCSHIFVSSGTDEFFRIGPPTSDVNVSVRERATVCLWHVSGGRRRFMISVSSLMAGDALLAYPLGGDAEDIGSKLHIVSGDEVELIVFRASQLSYGRMVTLHIDGSQSPAIPLIHQRFDNGAKPALLRSTGPDTQPAAPDPTPRTYAVRLSFWGLGLIVVTLLLAAIVIVLFVVLIVATCRSPPAGAMRHGLHSSTAARDAELFCDDTPKRLNQGDPFEDVANY